MLHAAAEHRDQYTELSARVDEVERHDGGQLSGRLELQDLLDYYCDLSVAHRRCLEVLALADRCHLSNQLDELTRRGTQNPRRRQRAEIIARRLQHWDQCNARAEASELSATTSSVGRRTRMRLPGSGPASIARFCRAVHRGRRTASAATPRGPGYAGAFVEGR